MGVSGSRTGLVAGSQPVAGQDPFHPPPPPVGGVPSVVSKVLVEAKGLEAVPHVGHRPRPGSEGLGNGDIVFLQSPFFGNFGHCDLMLLLGKANNRV